MTDLLVKAYRLINIYNSKSRTAHLYECGVTLYPAQVHTLEVIGENEGITLTETAAMLYVTKAAVSQCIKQLCGMGLIRREDKKAVGGAQELFLTGKGRSVFDEHHRRHSGMIKAIEDVWDTLSEDSREGIRKMLSITEEHISGMEE